MAPPRSSAIAQAADGETHYGDAGDIELLARIVGPRLAGVFIERWSTLRDVAMAGDGDWREAGLPAAKVRVLRAAFDLGARAASAPVTVGQRVSAPADVVRHFAARTALGGIEEFWAWPLDVRHRIVAEKMLARGTLTGVEVQPRDVFRWLLRLPGVANVIFAHNHPSGQATASRDDITLSVRLREVGALVGIVVLDHIVVAPGGFWVSIAERGWA